VPLPEKTAAALAGLSEEQRAMLEPVLAAMVEDVGMMIAAVKPAPVADMGGEKMLADEAKGLKADNARLTRERDAAVAEARTAKVSAARPAVARFAAAQGVPLADSADEAAIIAAAEAAAAKAGRPVKGLAALDAVALADSLAPIERQRLADPPKVETRSTRHDEDSP